MVQLFQSIAAYSAWVAVAINISEGAERSTISITMTYPATISFRHLSSHSLISHSLPEALGRQVDVSLLRWEGP